VSPREPLLELFVELIPPPVGHLTPLLHALAVGATVTLRPRAKAYSCCGRSIAITSWSRGGDGRSRHSSACCATGSKGRRWQAQYVLEGGAFSTSLGYDDELRALRGAKQPSTLRAALLAPRRSAQR
jgi:hypothetical protein